MARRRRLKTLLDASRDLISELPIEVKDRVLECLPTRDAARTALLSRHWNDVWLQHGQLALDRKFFKSVRKRQDDEGRTRVNIINNIIFLRTGPIKKFTLHIPCANPMPQQSDFDRWCRFLSRNGVEELDLLLYNDLEPEYQLPFCLLSCRTIKQLKVQGPSIDLPVNACDIFSNVTSLEFFYVEFKRGVNGIASSISIPKLEKLSFKHCVGINKFEISPPKLEILCVISSMHGVVIESRWLAPHLKLIKTLWLSGPSLMCMDASMFPSAINLQVMKLYGLNFGCPKQLAVVMQLLTKCPNLCELHILESEFGLKDDKEVASRLLEDPNSCFVSHELKILNTIKIESNCASALQMLFIIMLLSKSPALERFILKFWGMNAPEVRKIQRKLECFPRASSNAHIVFHGQ
ncbi:PREDICTED: F-box/FBD/LRR-repeat protein At1g13570-like [Ipomoea nil]|uniref:F-box/FBD/LRR-repeat protein At1g13570-like n=1 Tax=Ipomoea nil TaxID=35883 RepID=UPI0009011B6F|nr:PREDICTED: F-box/FBD/LRR-repeat protein At1g13570-like [Ipomoea nil]XP_019153509.1 PREDICTED: F-box/FBD/LRR-repeat protein At1g13570-like [Ipomoea nil]XP_019153510.1 PREDICTED: F-box/FBD/LRR-repeat protein At1g13570-like [Ipomoea nil]